MIAWQINRIEKEIEKNVSSEVYYGTMRLEAQVEAVKTLQYYLTNDKDLRQFVRQHDVVPNYDYYTLLTTVMNRIDILQEGNQCIDDVNIYFQDIGLSVSHSGKVNYISENEYNELHDKVQQTEGLLRVDKDRMYSSQIFKYIRWDKDFEMIINIQLSNEYIFDSIINQNPDEDADFFIYDHESGILLCEEESMETEMLERIRSYIDGDEQGENIRRFQYKGRKYLLVSRYSDYLNQSIYQCRLEDDYWGTQVVGTGILIVYLLFSVLVAVMFPYSVKRIVTIPIQRLIDAFHHLANNELDQSIEYRAADEFNYLYDEFNSMVKRLKDLIDENYKSKLRAQKAELLAQQADLLAQKAELKQLQAQIHPHFLYNTYFMLHRMILDEDEENALKLSNCLGIYMEYLAHNTENEAFLTQELYYVKSYLEIQQLRFAGRMKISIEDIPEEFRKLRIPRLILQPVVENYLKYGYEMSDGAGELYIHFAKDEDVLCITIGGGCAAIESDVIQKLQKRLAVNELEGEVSGLINIHRRLRIRYGNKSGIYLQTDEEGRLITKVLIHYGTGEENV